MMRALIAVFTVLLTVGCNTADETVSNNGQQLFNDICADCHKQSGKGNFLAGIPANSTTDLNKQQLMTLITTGSAEHQQMPTFSQLSETQAEHISDYLLSLRQP